MKLFHIIKALYFGKVYVVECVGTASFRYMSFHWSKDSAQKAANLLNEKRTTYAKKVHEFQVGITNIPIK